MIYAFPHKKNTSKDPLKSLRAIMNNILGILFALYHIYFSDLEVTPNNIGVPLTMFLNTFAFFSTMM